MIATWWAGLSVTMKILWGVTLTASLIFIIQTVLTFIGADADTDGLDGSGMGGADIAGGADGDISGGANLYTFRNLINFLLGFGWSAILLKDSIESNFLLMVVSVAVGAGLVALVMYMFKLLSRMQQSGNIDVYKSAVGCQGTVYLTIPASRGGEGKVQISINGAIREYNAQTEEVAPIKSGTPIKVVSVINDSTLLVGRMETNKN